MSFVSNYNNIYLQYKNDNYIEIEGVVEDLQTASFMGNGTDKFSINGVHFTLGGMISPGYKKMAAYGGKITKNGIFARIRYISYNGNNYIMKLEIAYP